MLGLQKSARMKRYLLFIICICCLSACGPDDVLPEEDTPPAEDILDLDDILGDYQTYDSHYFLRITYRYEGDIQYFESADTTITVKDTIHTITALGTDSFYVPYRWQIKKPYFKYIPESLVYMDSVPGFESRFLQFFPEQDSFYFELRFRMPEAIIYHILKGKKIE